MMLAKPNILKYTNTIRYNNAWDGMGSQLGHPHIAKQHKKLSYHRDSALGPPSSIYSQNHHYMGYIFVADNTEL